MDNSWVYAVAAPSVLCCRIKISVSCAKRTEQCSAHPSKFLPGQVLGANGKLWTWLQRCSLEAQVSQRTGCVFLTLALRASFFLTKLVVLSHCYSDIICGGSELWLLPRWGSGERMQAVSADKEASCERASFGVWTIRSSAGVNWSSATELSGALLTDTSCGPMSKLMIALWIYIGLKLLLHSSLLLFASSFHWRDSIFFLSFYLFILDPAHVLDKCWVSLCIYPKLLWTSTEVYIL